MVGLHRGLRSEKVRAGAEIVESGGKAIGIATDRQLDARCGIEDAGTGDRVGDSVLEFGVAEANAVGEIAGIEIDSGHVIARVVHIGERLEGVGDERKHASVLVKRKTIEEL